MRGRMAKEVESSRKKLKSRKAGEFQESSEDLRAKPQDWRVRFGPWKARHTF